MEINKKAFYFSLDALIAVTIIFGVILFLHPISKAKAPEMHLQDDLLNVISSITVRDYMLSSGAGAGYLTSLNPKNLNQSLLEQLVELDALNVESPPNTFAAQELDRKIFNGD